MKNINFTMLHPQSGLVKTSIETLCRNPREPVCLVAGLEICTFIMVPRSGKSALMSEKALESVNKFSQIMSTARQALLLSNVDLRSAKFIHLILLGCPLD